HTSSLRDWSSDVCSSDLAGIGFATARGLAESGAHVIVNGRSQASVDNALASLKKSYPTAQATGFAGDLTDAAVCDTLVKTHPARSEERRVGKEWRAWWAA